jgi:hypothetical protein
MIFRPYWVILALTLYYPFENVLLKWLPVSDRIYSILRFAGEATIYLLLAFMIFHCFWTNRRLRRTPIDIPLLALICIALLSIFVNNAPVLSGLINFRTLIRFIAVYYIVVNLNIDEVQARRLVKVIIIIAACESVLGIVQHFFGISSFWLPRQTDLEIAGYKKEFKVLSGDIERGAVIGTFEYTVSLALYLLISGVMVLVSAYSRRHYVIRRKSVAIVLMICFFMAVSFTYSRGVFFSMVLAVPLVLYFLRRRRMLLFLAGIAFLSMPVVILLTHGNVRYVKVKKQYVSPLYNLQMIFSSEYLNKTKEQRQWLLKEVGGTLIRTGTLIGYSPDTKTAEQKIVNSASGGLRRLISVKAFEDVFWVAMLAYYGIIGLGLFLIILYRLFKSSLWVLKFSNRPIFGEIGGGMVVLICLSLPLTFLIRTFEPRSFAFYFWMFAGLTMAEYIRLKEVR